MVAESAQLLGATLATYEALFRAGWYTSSTPRRVARVRGFGKGYRALMPVEMVIHALGQSPQSGEPVILLREQGGNRFLVIGIGPLEIMGIAAALSGSPPPRPMTHDLLCSAVEACGAKVTGAVIHSIIDGAFHARLALDVQGRHAELDSRSSDAIAVAVRIKIPILVEEQVLESAGFTSEGDPVRRGRSEEEPPQERISEEQLGAFRDVISGLNLDDMDPPKGGE